ncbi:MAG TPA: CDP-alcohol phosphatidyltransferase family protein [Bacteroidia bacterium]|nr:CDP-alcohol phosphatidyltransferase family protein [Bacteroidia bacterium]
MKKIPFALIGIRALFGVIILLLGMLQVAGYREYIVAFMVIGLLTDVFDGIIARRLNVSTPALRRLDSVTDQFFWLCVIGSAYVVCPEFFKANALKMYILGGSEAFSYIVSFAKFRKEVATHAIASKIWTLTLLGTFIQLVLSGNSGILFNICFYLGMLSRIEIIVILLILRKWSNDVPSIYHAILLRKGKAIKRNKLFNG